ncbi:unnamed protein product [Mytilus edulis]|uniref:Uncharacterized protein n=1 Tax=Mytilus edulis TaxID=6550 RepID=A0A8S3PWF8_MYTED|nr:unnamed protein product [Mytilus edulis]
MQSAGELSESHNRNSNNGIRRKMSSKGNQAYVNGKKQYSKDCTIRIEDSRKRKIVTSDENCNDDNVETVCQTEMNDVISLCEVNDTGRDEHIDNKKMRREASKNTKQENNAVKELINDKGDGISDTDGILDIEYSFYNNLYSCFKVDNVKMEEFISSIDHADDTILTVSDKSSIDEMFKYFDMYETSSGTKINMQKSEILPIGKENLKCIPNVYKEMFKGFDLLRDDIKFDLSTENVYDQPLFCNPNVLFDGKTVIWYDFINAGIVQVKDICYEVIEVFLLEMAIVEMIQNVTNHCDINSVVKDLIL